MNLSEKLTIAMKLQLHATRSDGYYGAIIGMSGAAEAE
jgi:hypothetical protein